MSNIPNDFNSKIYKSLHQDLCDLNEDEAAKHYENHGIYENRQYKIIPSDFNYKEYVILNPDLGDIGEECAKNHYEMHGYYEKRKYKLENSIENIELNNLLKHFLIIYNISIDKFKQESKLQFRYLCFKYISYIKNITLPNFLENSHLEYILIEYRCFPHLEFIIRNNILKLGNKWCFTIICGNLNYNYMKNMCNSISSKINIIKTNYDNLLPSDYSKFLSSLEFWNLVKGEKILISQEDSIIFKNNIDDFLYFDYIGAPWKENKNDNNCCVGNGGLSLRTKKVMIQIINTKNIFDTKFNSCTLEYIKNTNSFVPPEDVYFTKNMEDCNIGILADRDSAVKFSIESVFNKDSFGGHNFWESDKDWKARMYKYNIFKFKPNYDVSFLEHRGGWKYILDELSDNNFFSFESNIDFFDVMEKQFLWNTNFVCNNKWAGILHCTNITPPYLNNINLDIMFQNPNFIKSLDNCVFIISLSSYLSKYLNKEIRCKLNKNIPIYTLTHPVLSKNIPLFNFDEFIKNDNKILIQIGQQLRKMSSIYLLNSIECTKYWLTGCKDFNKMNQLLEKEIEYLNIDKSKLNKNVKMYYTKTFEEYDELLCKNLVFVELFDAAANNTVLECIIRNTPIIINKIEGVVDYLGENYPLYYNHLDEVPALINSQLILKAHLYLANMNKQRFMIKTFLNDIFNIVNKHFLFH
jgi:hypothetical protein